MIRDSFDKTNFKIAEASIVTLSDSGRQTKCGMPVAELGISHINNARMVF
jgi:hypothetical protein